MARSTRESILTAAAELMRRKGYGAFGMKDVVAASGAPIGSLYHHFPGGKAQIAREALINAGAAYGLAHPDPRRRVRRSRRGRRIRLRQAAADMAETGFANMCPVASVAAEVADTLEELRDAAAGIFTGWLDGGTAYFVSRGLPDERRPRPDRHAGRRARGRLRPGQDAARRGTLARRGTCARTAVPGYRAGPT